MMGRGWLRAGAGRPLVNRSYFSFHTFLVLPDGMLLRVNAYMHFRRPFKSLFE